MPRRIKETKNIQIPKLEVRNPRDVFMLFSALNAMGYNDENNTKGMTLVRKKIRNVLLGYDWNEKYPKLKKAFKTYHPWHLLNAILAKPKKIKKTSTLDGFISDLRKFSKEPLVRKLWRDFKIYQTKEAKKLFPLFEKETARLIAFINQLPKRTKKIVFITNPLDAYWSGFALSAGEIGYIIVGPGAEKNHGELIRHELLHLLTSPLRLPRRITADRHHKRLATMGYGNPRIINREYVVRSLNLLYESVVLKRNISKATKYEEKNFPHIREALTFMKTKKEKGRL